MVDWSAVTHFNATEFGTDADRMHPTLIYALDDLRDLVEVPIIVHLDGLTAGRPETPDSQHPLGRAVDCHAVGLSLFRFWLAATSLPALRGIGAYPYWSAPGLHLDVRPTPARSYWWQDAKKAYRAVDETAMRTMLGVK